MSVDIKHTPIEMYYLSDILAYKNPFEKSATMFYRQELECNENVDIKFSAYDAFME